MHPDWHNFLAEHGAVIDAEGVVQFNNPVEERQITDQGSIVCDLSPLGLIKVSGNDAENFLQSQFTNDISQVDNTRSQLTAYCNPKGRMLALFRIIKNEDSYLLQTPKALITDLIKKLKIYVFRADVQLQSVSEEFVQIGVSGPEALESLSLSTKTSDLEINATINADQALITRIHGVQPRFHLIGSPVAMPSLWEKLSRTLTPVGYPCWKWLDITAGIPSVSPENVEELIPQMVNLDQLNGISFSKGCYPGQEIVARLRYLGKIKQRMFLASVSSNRQPTPGDPVLCTTDTQPEPRKVGRIISAAPNVNNGFDLLIVLNQDLAASKHLFLENAEIPVTIRALPYTSPTPLDTSAH